MSISNEDRFDKARLMLNALGNDYSVDFAVIPLPEMFVVMLKTEASLNIPPNMIRLEQ